MKHLHPTLGQHPLGTAGLAWVVFLVVVWAAPPASAEPAEGCVTRAAIAMECAPACPPPDCGLYECSCWSPPQLKCPAKYNNLRFKENWKACLCVPVCERGDWTDAIKAINLGTSWFRVDFGGQVRFRYESWSNQRFVNGSNDQYLLGRFRAHADMHFFDHFRVFVEGIYADAWKRDLGPRPIFVNQGDLLNGFLELYGDIGAYTLGAAIGRRELQFGKQRLISPLDWANTRRTFEGGYAYAQRGPHRIDGFWTNPVVMEPYEFDEPLERDDIDFWGLYYTNSQVTCRTWDLYFLGLDRREGAYYSGAGDEQRYTVGGRLAWNVEGTRFDLDIEGGYQFGDFGDETISAGFATFYCGWKPAGCAWKPHVLVGVDWASGDREGGSQGTFNQLYPLGHAFLGFADILGRQNILSPHLTVKVTPMDKLELRADYMGFWRDSAEDGIYNVGGGLLRAPTVSDKYIGQELDLSFKWAIDRHWRLAGGWAHFFTGAFLEKTGPDAPIDFVWLEVQYTF